MFSTVPVGAQEQRFSDVPTNHVAAQAIEYLVGRGIVQGYADGTFKPQNSVNRAEAIKLIVAPLLAPEQLSNGAESVFHDVPADAWFAPYVNAAQQVGVIAGPPEKTAFLGNATVIKAEFLKMLFLANAHDPIGSLQEIRLPLSDDVADVDAWFYPYMRYALASSLIMVSQDGTLSPGQELTRGDTALMIYHFLMFNEKRRTQALLSEAENEILIILAMLESKNVPQAEYASARALLAARGAEMQKSDEPVVKGALKISQAFRSLMRAYNAGIDMNYEEVIRLAKEAWQYAEDAASISASLLPITTQVKEISSGMAESARELQNGM